MLTIGYITVELLTDADFAEMAKQEESKWAP